MAMKKIRVLVVDDHAIFRAGLLQFLSSEADMECVGVAENGREAIQLTADLLPDVVILDIAMPEMDGIAVAKQIRSEYPGTAILMLSAYKYDSYVLASIRAGVRGYLLKNVSPLEVVNAVRSINMGQAVFNLEAAGKIFGNIANMSTTEILGFKELRSRELEVLKLAAHGMSNKEISATLDISEHTVRSHFVNVFRKLGVGSRTEAALLALRSGLINLDS
jgi:DNA-binding NarL/FixJ family response regulator